MGKASSSKKVARAARAGGTRRSGQRRPMGFPIAIAAVVIVGLMLVLFARDRRNATAFPRTGDHVHSAYDVFACVEGSADGSTTTTAPVATGDSTNPTASTSTTIAAPGDVPGEFLPSFNDVGEDALGIHTHADGVIHIHPFADSAAGRKATLGVFLDQVSVSMTNDTLTLPDGTVYQEGTTKCEGGKDGELQVAKWNNVDDAVQGSKPNEIFTSGFDQIRLGQNESFTIAFMPSGSTIPAQPDVGSRIANITDVQPTGPGDSATTVPGASGAPAANTETGAPTNPPDTATTVPATAPQ